MAATMDFGMFDSWLQQKLQEINKDVDLDVFPSYVTGILEDEEEGDLLEVVTDALEAINADGDSSALEQHCMEIIATWKRLHAPVEEKKSVMSVDEHLSKLMENQTFAPVKPKQRSKKACVDEASKAAILAQYENSRVAEADSDEDVDGSDEDALESNCNASDVKNRELEQRAREKQAADLKKVKDKEDREKQKQKAEDRKDVEKKRTQKGEKRR